MDLLRKESVIKPTWIWVTAGVPEMPTQSPGGLEI
jgi:hypothetical protein